MKIKEGITEKCIKHLLKGSEKNVIVLDMDGAVIEISDTFRARFQSGEIKNIKELLDRNSADTWDEFSRLAKKTNNIAYEIMILLKPGMLVPMKVKLVYCDKVKRLTAFFEVSTKVLTNEEKTKLNLFHKTDNLVVLIDRNGIVRDINESCYAFFQFPRSFFINKKAIDFISLFSVNAEKYNNHLKLAVENGYCKVLKRYEISPDDVRYYQITTFYDEETMMYSIRMTDKTENMALQEQLAHTDSLSTVGQLAASIAHEIRNPLTTLKGFTQLLKLSAVEETMKYLNVIDDEVDRMESILSEMLVLAKPSKNEKKTLSLQELLSDILLVISPKANFEGIEIERSGDVISSDSIYGDIIKLKQVMLNIMKNALEAMTSGGKLTIGTKKEEDGQLTVTIADTGKGMSVIQLKKVFTPFFTTRSEGTGLGLSFVLETIEDHGGKISVESEVGKGTKFILTFPAAISLVKNEVIGERETAILGIMA